MTTIHIYSCVFLNYTLNVDCLFIRINSVEICEFVNFPFYTTFYFYFVVIQIEILLIHVESYIEHIPSIENCQQITFPGIRQYMANCQHTRPLLKFRFAIN